MMMEELALVRAFMLVQRNVLQALTIGIASS